MIIIQLHHEFKEERRISFVESSQQTKSRKTIKANDFLTSLIASKFNKQIISISPYISYIPPFRRFHHSSEHFTNEK